MNAAGLRQADRLGEYIVVELLGLPGLPVNAEVGRSSPKIAELGIGSIVEVLELGEDGGRVRGRIGAPHNGWISTRQGVRRFAERRQATATNTQYQQGKLAL